MSYSGPWWWPPRVVTSTLKCNTGLACRHYQLGASRQVRTNLADPRRRPSGGLGMGLLKGLKEAVNGRRPVGRWDLLH